MTNLPDFLQELLLVTVGMPWPEGDEKDLEASSDAWMAFKGDVADVQARYRAVARQFDTVMAGTTAEQVVDLYGSMVPSQLAQVVDAADRFAAAMLRAAADFQKTKIMVVAMLVMLAAAIAELLASLFGAFLIPAVVAVFRLGIAVVLRQLLVRLASFGFRELALRVTTRSGLAQLGRLGLRAGGQLAVDVAKYGAMGAAFMGGLDIAVDGVQNTMHTAGGQQLREGVDWTAFVMASVLGALGGGFFGVGRSIGRGLDVVSRDFRRAVGEEIEAIAGREVRSRAARGFQGFADLGYSGMQVGIGGAAANQAINVTQGPLAEALRQLFPPADGASADSGAPMPMAAATDGALSLMSRAQGARLSTPNLSVGDLSLGDLSIGDLTLHDVTTASPGVATTATGAASTGQAGVSGDSPASPGQKGADAGQGDGGRTEATPRTVSQELHQPAEPLASMVDDVPVVGDAPAVESASAVGSAAVVEGASVVENAPAAGSALAVEGAAVVGRAATSEGATVVGGASVVEGAAVVATASGVESVGGTFGAADPVAHDGDDRSSEAVGTGGVAALAPAPVLPVQPPRVEVSQDFLAWRPRFPGETLGMFVGVEELPATRSRTEFPAFAAADGASFARDGRALTDSRAVSHLKQWVVEKAWQSQPDGTALYGAGHVADMVGPEVATDEVVQRWWAEAGFTQPVRASLESRSAQVPVARLMSWVNGPNGSLAQLTRPDPQRPGAGTYLGPQEIALAYALLPVETSRLTLTQLADEIVLEHVGKRSAGRPVTFAGGAGPRQEHGPGAGESSRAVWSTELPDDFSAERFAALPDSVLPGVPETSVRVGPVVVWRPRFPGDTLATYVGPRRIPLPGGVAPDFAPPVELAFVRDSTGSFVDPDGEALVYRWVVGMFGAVNPDSGFLYTPQEVAALSGLVDAGTVTAWWGAAGLPVETRHHLYGAAPLPVAVVVWEPVADEDTLTTVFGQELSRYAVMAWAIAMATKIDEATGLLYTPEEVVRFSGGRVHERLLAVWWSSAGWSPEARLLLREQLDREVPVEVETWQPRWPGETLSMFLGQDPPPAHRQADHQPYPIPARLSFARIQKRHFVNGRARHWVRTWVVRQALGVLGSEEAARRSGLVSQRAVEIWWEEAGFPVNVRRDLLNRRVEALRLVNARQGEAGGFTGAVAYLNPEDVHQIFVRLGAEADGLSVQQLADRIVHELPAASGTDQSRSSGKRRVDRVDDLPSGRSRPPMPDAAVSVQTAGTVPGSRRVDWLWPPDGGREVVEAWVRGQAAVSDGRLRQLGAQGWEGHLNAATEVVSRYYRAPLAIEGIGGGPGAGRLRGLVADVRVLVAHQLLDHGPVAAEELARVVANRLIGRSGEPPGVDDVVAWRPRFPGDTLASFAAELGVVLSGSAVRAWVVEMGTAIDRETGALYGTEQVASLSGSVAEDVERWWAEAGLTENLRAQFFGATTLDQNVVRWTPRFPEETWGMFVGVEELPAGRTRQQFPVYVVPNVSFAKRTDRRFVDPAARELFRAWILWISGQYHKGRLVPIHEIVRLAGTVTSFTTVDKTRAEAGFSQAPRVELAAAANPAAAGLRLGDDVLREFAAWERRFPEETLKMFAGLADPPAYVSGYRTFSAAGEISFSQVSNKHFDDLRARALLKAWAVRMAWDVAGPLNATLGQDSVLEQMGELIKRRTLRDWWNEAGFTSDVRAILTARSADLPVRDLVPWVSGPQGSLARLSASGRTSAAPEEIALAYARLPDAVTRMTLAQVADEIAVEIVTRRSAGGSAALAGAADLYRGEPPPDNRPTGGEPSSGPRHRDGEAGASRSDTMSVVRDTHGRDTFFVFGHGTDLARSLRAVAAGGDAATKLVLRFERDDTAGPVREAAPWSVSFTDGRTPPLFLFLTVRDGRFVADDGESPRTMSVREVAEAAVSATSPRVDGTRRAVLRPLVVFTTYRANERSGRADAERLTAEVVESMAGLTGGPWPGFHHVGTRPPVAAWEGGTVLATRGEPFVEHGVLSIDDVMMTALGRVAAFPTDPAAMDVLTAFVERGAPELFRLPGLAGVHDPVVVVLDGHDGGGHVRLALAAGESTVELGGGRLGEMFLRSDDFREMLGAPGRTVVVVVRNPSRRVGRGGVGYDLATALRRAGFDNEVLVLAGDLRVTSDGPRFGPGADFRRVSVRTVDEGSAALAREDEATYRKAMTDIAAGRPPVEFFVDGVPDGVSSREGTRIGLEVEVRVATRGGVPDTDAFDAVVQAIGADARDAGLIDWVDGQALPDGHQPATDKWLMTREISDVNGLEFTTPVLAPEHRPWHQLVNLLSLIDHDDVDTTTMGGHVNTSFVGHTEPATYAWVSRLVKAFEATLYRLANVPGGLGHRRVRVVGPNPLPLDPAEVHTADDVARLSLNKYDAVNFTHVRGDDVTDRLEFRFWSASKEPAVWQVRTELSLAIQRAAQNPANHERLTELAEEPDLLWHPGIEHVTDEVRWQRFQELLSLLDLSPAARRQAVQLYAWTQPWQRTPEVDPTLRSVSVVASDERVYFPAPGETVADAVTAVTSLPHLPEVQVVKATVASEVRLWDGGTVSFRTFAEALDSRFDRRAETYALLVPGANVRPEPEELSLAETIVDETRAAVLVPAGAIVETADGRVLSTGGWLLVDVFALDDGARHLPAEDLVDAVLAASVEEPEGSDGVDDWDGPESWLLEETR
ncbi:hypothetical protein [Actinophytocola oryzae]|uniref:Outer membrane channel protein CpnT-like N-terminal domain-containing protein n=1 Tax=Actinophytocola oryzae TaxID=502181 RepID=A0A4V3FQE7_9PSEU|nr:hypothetical protein [Actinophytocola oryzae]TDV38586.1 hypothetical protein CLV71_12729 [Actinophytocola oryzae]